MRMDTPLALSIGHDSRWRCPGIDLDQHGGAGGRRARDGHGTRLGLVDDVVCSDGVNRRLLRGALRPGGDRRHADVQGRPLLSMFKS